MQPVVWVYHQVCKVYLANLVLAKNLLQNSSNDGVVMIKLPPIFYLRAFGRV